MSPSTRATNSFCGSRRAGRAGAVGAGNGRLRCVCTCGGAAVAAEHGKHLERILAEQQAHDDDDDDRAAAEAHAAATEARRRAARAFLDIVAPAKLVPAHGALLVRAPF